MDIRQSPAHAQYLRSLGWHVENVPLVNGKKAQIFLLRFPVLGCSFAKFQRYSARPDLHVLRTLFRQYKVFSFSFEPAILNAQEARLHAAELVKLGAKLDKNVYVPSTTLQIDLRKTAEQLRSSFDENARRLTREKIHAAAQVVIQNAGTATADNRHLFWKAGKKNNAHWHLTWNLFDKLCTAYGKDAYLCTYKDQSNTDMSGILLLRTGQTMNYFLAWTAPEGKKRGAQYWTVFQCFQFANKLGCTVWDFEGLEDPRFPRPSWHGFSMFKRKFGGQEIQFGGCYTRFNILDIWRW